MTTPGTPTSSGPATQRPTNSAATTVSTAVMSAISHSGSAQRTDQPSCSTSREVRVSRSPVPADSTVPIGQRQGVARRSPRAARPAPPRRTRTSGTRAARVSSVCATSAAAMTQGEPVDRADRAAGLHLLDDRAQQARGDQARPGPRPRAGPASSRAGARCRRASVAEVGAHRGRPATGQGLVRAACSSARGRAVVSRLLTRAPPPRGSPRRGSPAPRPAGRGGGPWPRPGRPTRNTTSSARSSSSGLVVVTTVVRPRRTRGQPLGDPRLGVGVDGRGRLDEQQHLRVGEQRAGQHEPLPLAPGERAAALGDPRAAARRAGPSTTSSADAACSARARSASVTRCRARRAGRPGARRTGRCRCR